MISWNQSYKLIIVHGLKKNSLTFNLLVIIAFNAKISNVLDVKLLNFFVILKKIKSFVSTILQYPSRKGLFGDNKLLTQTTKKVIVRLNIK